jgi:hypothetical protein
MIVYIRMNFHVISNLCHCSSATEQPAMYNFCYNFFFRSKFRVHGRHSTDIKQISFCDSYASRLSVCITYNFYLPPLLPTHCSCSGLLLRPITLNDPQLSMTPPHKDGAPRTHFYVTTHSTQDRPPYPRCISNPHSSKRASADLRHAVYWEATGIGYVH